MKPVDRIKRARRESHLLRLISKLIAEQALDDPALASVNITHVELNADQSLCFVFVFNEDGEARFKEQLEYLKLYKPSLRTAVAQELSRKYAPDIVFRFDEQFKKQIALEEIFSKIKDSEKAE